MLLYLAIDDLCRRLAVEDLGLSRPRDRERGAQDAWLAGLERLEAERRRLAEMGTATVSTL